MKLGLGVVAALAFTAGAQAQFPNRTVTATGTLPQQRFIITTSGATVIVPPLADRQGSVPRTRPPQLSLTNGTIFPFQVPGGSASVSVGSGGGAGGSGATPECEDFPSLKVNGRAVEPAVVNGFVALTRSWKAGDRIDLVLPMEVQRVKASDKVAADRGRVVLRYGPLVYNIESVDQDVNQVLSPAAPLSTRWEPDLLGGVMVIQGTSANGSPLTAIPNYARSNRGGRSLVWLRDRPQGSRRPEGPAVAEPAD